MPAVLESTLESYRFPCEGEFDGFGATKRSRSDVVLRRTLECIQDTHLCVQ